MFSKTNTGTTHGSNGLPSIVSADMVIEGNLTGEGTVQVEGKVLGDVRCQNVTLGEQGEITGKLQCETAQVHGTVNGEIQAKSLSLSASASVVGDIMHEEISIEAGARVEGRLVRRDSNQTQLNLVVGETAETAS